MFILDFVMGVIDLIRDIRFAKKYGFGSILWDLAGIACLALAIAFFRMDWIVIGVLGMLCFIFCLIYGFRRMWRDVKRTKEEQQKDNA